MSFSRLIPIGSLVLFFFFFFKQNTAYEIGVRLVGSEMCIREQAITKVAKSGNSSEGATLYVTASPCIECSKLIIQAGIRRVVYRDAYRLQDGPDLLRKSGIEVEQVDCE